MFLRLFIFAFLVMTASTFAQTPILDTGVSQTLAKWRAGNYGDVRYKLNLTLEKMAPTLKGSTEVSVNLKQASDIVLDWRKIKGKEQFYKIANVELNGAKVEAKEINEHLVIAGGKQGANTVKLDFESPIATSGAAITRYVDKEDGAEYVYSLFVPSDASTAFPVFDQPDLKARFELTIKTSTTWKVISNGKIKSFSSAIYENFLPNKIEATTENIYKFEETQPISTYVFAFAAGDFAEMSEPPASAGGLKLATENANANESASKNSNVSNAKLNPPAHAGGSDLAMKIYIRKSQSEKFKQHAAETFRLNREGVKYLEGYFDYKFPFPKYDLVLIPEFPFGGMEHAGATFLRESSVIFPSEPTANDYISRANLIFHEAAHQWFGDTVTMKWFDDLWLKEGFAEFMAYKTLEKVLPEYNAWKAFYERNKPLAYLTDSTRGTTPIYQEIPNLSQAKSAYGNIVYRKAPSFLRQAEFYLGADKFQTAVRAFLKKHEFANAEWTDLVKEFETSSGQNLELWARTWVKYRGLPVFRLKRGGIYVDRIDGSGDFVTTLRLEQKGVPDENISWIERLKIVLRFQNGETETGIRKDTENIYEYGIWQGETIGKNGEPLFVFPNYQDYGYGIFLLDERSRAYVLKNIQNEPDDFLRSMMWGTLWDSVREAELAPADYVTLAIKNIATEKDELTIQTILARASTAMNYYLSEPPASAGGTTTATESANIISGGANVKSKTPAHAGGSDNAKLAAQLETLLLDKMQNAPTLGLRITFYRAFLNVASTDKAKQTLKDVLSGRLQIKDLKLKTKDKFDVAAKLLILSDKDAPNLLTELEKTETSDEAKRYAYAARAGIATAENKQKFFSDFVGNKEISESYIESAFSPFNSTKHADLTLPFLENALKELPNLRRNRKIFFVNGWLSAFIGGQKSEQALQIVNKFLADNPNLDKDLRLKVLEVADGLERAVKIRKKFADVN